MREAGQRGGSFGVASSPRVSATGMNEPAEELWNTVNSPLLSVVFCTASNVA